MIRNLISKPSTAFDRFSVETRSTFIFILAIWFGIVSGFVEGAIFLSSQAAGRIFGISSKIVYISTFFNLLIFFMIGLVLFLLSPIMRRTLQVYFSVFWFSLITAIDWIALITYEKIHFLAVLLLATGISVEVSRRLGNKPHKSIDFFRRSIWPISGLAFATFLFTYVGQIIGERLDTANLSELLPDSPSVLFIVVDALRSDHLSSYGYGRRTSPNLDRLAEEGVKFEYAFSTSSWTLPSHVSLLTGLYPYQHGVEWNSSTALKRSSAPTLAEELRAEGYRTAGFSANTFWVTREQGLDRGFIHFEDFFNSFEDMFLRTFYGRALEKLLFVRLRIEDIPARKSAEEINRSVINWIQRDPNIPYFIFINYMDVHDPYLPPRPYRSMYSELPDPGGVLNWRVGRKGLELTAGERQSEIDAYDGAIAYLDNSIGELLEDLKDRGLMDNTLVVVTSDHGEAFGEHGIYLHANSLYREVIQVPLLLSWPDHLPSNLQIDQPVSNANLPATIMDLVGFADDHKFQGRSYRSLWESSSVQVDWPDPLAEMAQQDWQPKAYPVQSGWLKSLIDPQWHFIQHQTGSIELFDWRADPLEARNLIEDPKNKEIIDRLRLKLMTFVQ